MNRDDLNEVHQILRGLNMRSQAALRLGCLFRDYYGRWSYPSWLSESTWNNMLADPDPDMVHYVWGVLSEVDWRFFD